MVIRKDRPTKKWLQRYMEKSTSCARIVSGRRKIAKLIKKSYIELLVVAR